MFIAGKLYTEEDTINMLRWTPEIFKKFWNMKTTDKTIYMWKIILELPTPTPPI